MHLPARRRCVTAWIALVAMLAFALVPTLSRALAFGGTGSGWTEVCTPQGTKLVALDDGTGRDAPAPALQLDACGLCTLATEGGAPLPMAAPPAVLPLRGHEVPALFLHAPRTLHAWASAQARAPPLRG